MSQDNQVHEKGKSPRDRTILAAWIGAGALIVAAIITGVFYLAGSQGSGSAGSAIAAPSQKATSSTPVPTPVSAIPVAAVLRDPNGKSVRSVAYSFDEKYLATADANGHTYLWAMPADTLAVTLSDPASRGANAVTFPQNDTMNATADGNGHIYLWQGIQYRQLADPISKGEVPRGFRTVHPIGWTSGKVK